MKRTQIDKKNKMKWKIQHLLITNQRSFSWTLMVEREVFSKWSIKSIEIKVRILRITLGSILQCQVRTSWIETRHSIERTTSNQGTCQKIKSSSINLSKILILIYEKWQKLLLESMKIFQKVIVKNSFQRLISWEWIKIVLRICPTLNHRQKQSSMFLRVLIMVNLQNLMEGRILRLFKQVKRANLNGRFLIRGISVQIITKMLSVLKTIFVLSVTAIDQKLKKGFMIYIIINQKLVLKIGRSIGNSNELNGIRAKRRNLINDGWVITIRWNESKRSQKLKITLKKFTKRLGFQRK